MTKKNNKTFLILSVLGIIFVVCGHCNHLHILASNVFPFYSFHMALFAFISGYFFKERKLLDFLKTKIKKLIVPYFIWNIIYGGIVNILKYFNIINFGKEFSLFNIIVAPFYGTSNQFVFNVSAWFVLSIFFIQLIYLLINKINKKLKINTEFVILFIFSIIAFFVIELVKKGYNTGLWFLATRICFLMPFYAIGQIYKKYEKYDKLKNATYFGIIILIQCILLQKFNLIYNLNILKFKSNYIVYLISSMTGIMFWLRISKIISKYIGENKIINYIGNNTYTVMMHHVFVFYIINSFIYIVNIISGRFNKFNLESYKKSCWYFYNEKNEAMLLVYVILGIAVPLLVKYFGTKIKNKVKENYKNNKNIESC